MLAGVYRECLELSCRERLGPSLVQIIKSRGVVRCLLFSCYSVLKSRGVPPQSKNRTSKVGRSTPASILFSKQNKRRIGEIVVQNLPKAAARFGAETDPVSLAGAFQDHLPTFAGSEIVAGHGIPAFAKTRNAFEMIGMRRGL